MTIRSAVFAACMTLVMAPAAFAADLAPQPVEPMAPAYLPFSWTGFYVGVQGGYQWTDNDGNVTGITLPVSFPYSLNPDSGFIGGHVGYNYQFYNNLVIGAEADANYLFDNKDSGTFAAVGVPAALGITAEQSYNASIRGRVGYAIDRFLPYIAGGVSFSDLDTTYGPAGGPGLSKSSSDRVGWNIGAGLEYAITDNILARIEYRYTDYGSKRFTDTANNFTDRVKLHSNSVLVGLSYKF